MCWMSAVIDDEAKTHGYVTGGEGTQKTKLHKIIYADDGTYFARTREGMQYTATALEKFCAATGIVVKPEKSYVYANHDGPPITIKTYKGNTNYKLKTDKAVKVAEIKQDEFWRHLGNIQNNKGETKLVDTEMYDGSMHEGVVSRVTKMIQTMRKRKGLNEGGTYRTLQSLIIPTILYPMKYANGNNDIIEKLEKQINQLLKEKCRVPNGV